MIRKIYKISCDPNNLTCQSAYVRWPSRSPLSNPLHGIILRHKTVIHVNFIVLSTSVIISEITVTTTQNFLVKHHFTDTSTIISTRIFALIPISDSIQTIFLMQSKSDFPIWFYSSCMRLIYLFIHILRVSMESRFNGALYLVECPQKFEIQIGGML